MSRILSAIAVALSLILQPPVRTKPLSRYARVYEFANYEAGIIVPQQLTKDVFDSVIFIDTRDSEQFAKGTIPGAKNIEWREVLSRSAEIPRDKKVILFCNTGRSLRSSHIRLARGGS